MTLDSHMDRVPAQVRRTPTSVFSAIIAAAAAGAAVAPMELTGQPVVDAVERALITAAFVFIASHGRRSATFASAALATVAARDVALSIILVALGSIIVGLSGDRRRKDLNALSTGLIANAILWSPAGQVPPVLLVATALAPIPALVSGRRQLRTRHRVMVDRCSAALTGFVVLAVVLAGVGALRALGDIRSGADDARLALDLVRDGETERAAVLLADAEANLAAGRSALNGWTLGGRLVPGVAQNIDAASTAIDEARSIAGAGADLVTTTYEDLRYRGRIDLDEVAGLEAPAARAQKVLDDASANLDDALDGPVAPILRDQIRELNAEITDTGKDLARARSIIERVPSIMGGDAPRRYLAVMMTPAELRGAGGMIGSWVDIELADGQATLVRSGRIADLIDYDTTPGRRDLEAPADYVRRYGRFRPQHYVQDASLSPNWPSVAQNLAAVYPQAGGIELDGVIGIDPAGLAALLELTGPITVEGLEGRLDADNAVDVLTRQQYLDHPERAEREEVLDAATRRTFEVLTSATLPSPRALGDALGPAVRGRHIALWLADDDDQALIEQLGADGALEVPPGADGFMVLQQNAGNNKMDAYQQREIAYDLIVDADDGSFTGTMSVTVHNEVPDIDLPWVVWGNQRGAPGGSNVATFSVHAPFVVTAAAVDGQAFIPGHGVEAGLNAWDTPLLITPAGGSSTIELSIEGTLDLSGGYRAVLLPQPVVSADQIEATITLRGGTFGDRDQDFGAASVTAAGDTLHISGLLDETIDIVVPVDR